MRRRTALMLPSLLLPALAAGKARAAGFPDRPLHMIIPFTAGGSNDIVGRLVAEHMSDRLGQTIVVENKGGAGGLIGTDLVAKAEPDGYTFLLGGSGSFLISSLVQPNVPYDIIKDFTPIGFIGNAPNVITVNPKVPVHDMKELQGYAAKAKPPMSFATPGVGTTGHALGAMIAQVLDVPMEFIPYRGTGPALTDVLAGRVDMITNAAAPLKPHIEDKRLRAIALAAPKRSAILPDLPTTVEQGFPGVQSATWYALLGPAGMPPDRVSRLHAALNETLADQVVQKRMIEEGVEIEPSPTPADFAKFLLEDRQRWKQVVDRAGMKVE
ncbi:tripartite tricarboxylate transporter substrate binding protein [Roseomonas sp. M0104]|uniref:Tripartite tricarboxylate transporter substrate binding protein n=1 Tax=Teichococcus coralli TaxID=2545983 RepID=A0A845BFU6_9PROT|nr:tripartite tricarboxylate transporter substrate binding protein [Pseudoroseomonas coralli]MXP64102.1 tripartite tricarboxylate transporter substrate binding protein [Pseudoroseomonas coralli]